MNEKTIRGLALLVGLTAILCELKIGALLSGAISDHGNDGITFLSALLIAGGFMFFCRISERCESDRWIWIAFGVCGAVVLFAGPLRAWLPYGLQTDFRRLKLTFFYWGVALMLLPLLLKIASDLGEAKANGRRSS